MNHYAQIDPTTRVCVGILQTEAVIADDSMVPLDHFDRALLGQAHNRESGAWTAPQVTTAPAQRHLSKRAFRARFSKAERVAVEWAAVDKPEAPAAERMLAASLRADLKDQDQAAYIDLADPDVLGGLMALESVGILSSGRAQAIHSAPVQPAERP